MEGFVTTREILSQLKIFHPEAMLSMQPTGALIIAEGPYDTSLS